MTILNLKINSKPLPYIVEKKIINHSVIKGDYNKLSQKLEQFLKKKIIKYNQKYNLSITIDTIRSIRSANIKDNIIKRHPLMMKYAKKIYNDYKHSSIKILSKKYDYSPMSIFRLIMKLKGFSKENIKKLLRNPDKIKTLMSLRDYKQFVYSQENDYFVTIDQQNQLKKACEFEDKIQDFLDSHSVKYKTQEELVKEQIEKYDKPINTPDFLILSDLTINNKTVKWIDAKNFYGANTFMIKHKIKKQIKKYLNTYGPGAIIFSIGFSEKLHFDNTVLISLT
jgi:hypothetical protein